MEPDRQIELRHQFEERQRFRRRQRRSKHVGEYLHADRAQLPDRVLRFLEQAIRIVHRQRRDECREAVRVPRHELGHALVGEPRQIGGHRRRSELLERRRAQADHLRIVAEHVHDAEAFCEIDDAWDRPHAFVHVLAVGRDLEHPLVVALRKDVVEDVEFHRSRPGISPP